jgi:hypothetical protein
VYFEAHTGPAWVMNPGITRYSYDVKTSDGELIARGEDRISTEYEETDP